MNSPDPFLILPVEGADGSGAMHASGDYWLYVVDHDRARFGILELPTSDPQPWQARIDEVSRLRRRQLESGMIPVAAAPTITAAVAAIRASVPGFKQFEPRIILAAAQP